MDSLGFALIYALIGFAIGSLLFWMAGRRTLKREQKVWEDQARWFSEADQRLRDTFESLASQALRTNSEEFAGRSTERVSGLVSPLQESLAILSQRIQEVEEKRAGAYSGLEEQLRSLLSAQQMMQSTTTKLTEALRSPTVRGRWGEIQLRRVVEMAGLQNQVSFDEQAASDAGRPDMVILLPNGGKMAIDSKTPMESYLDAIDAQDDNTKRVKLQNHVNAVKGRIRELARKQYWTEYADSPDFVIMFVPNEACLASAFELDPGLLEMAINQKVLIASPVTLLALLQAVAYGWQQHQVTENARHIADEAKDLYNRIGKVVEHLGSLGANLNRSTDSYNSLLGSIERRLVPSVRRLEELRIATSEMTIPKPLESQSRLPQIELSDE